MDECETCKNREDDNVVSCYCDEDQGAGYTFDDEHGPCDFCLGKCSNCDRELEAEK